MADRFIASTGSNTSPYDTWAKAATSFTTAASGSAAGDRFIVDAGYSTSEAGITVTLPGTPANPNQIISATPGSGSAFTESAGAIIQSSTTALTINGSYAASGVTFRGTSAPSHALTLHAGSGDVGVHESCKYEHTGGGTSSSIAIGCITAAQGSSVLLRNPTFKTGNGGQFVSVSGHIEVKGGSWASGGTLPNIAFKPSTSAKGVVFLVDGMDLSNFATTTILTSQQGGYVCRFRGITLPTGWGVTTGFPITLANKVPGQQVELYDFMIGSTKWRQWIEDYAASIKSETTVKVTANAHSLKVATTTNTNLGGVGAKLRDMHARLAGGVSKTLTVDLCTDNVTLTDKEAILDVDFFNTSGSYLYSRSTSNPAGLASSATNLTSSSTTWSTSGLSTPVRQKLELSITPAEDGYCIARVRAVKPSTTIYVDPNLQVS